MKKSRSHVRSIIAISAGLCGIPLIAKADTYQDYGGVGDQHDGPNGNIYVDIASVNITDNQTYLIFNLNLNPAANILASNGSETYGSYLIGFQTGTAGTGNTSVTDADPYSEHNMGSSQGLNYYLDSWTNQMGAGIAGEGGYSLFNWSGSAWNMSAGVGTTDPGQMQDTFNPVLSADSITYYLPLYAWSPSNLATNFNGLAFQFDVYTTFDTPGTQSAYDALSSGAAVTQTSATYNPFNNSTYDSALQPGYASQVYTLLNWNNTGGAGNGSTWDTAQANWGNGGATPVAFSSVANTENVLFGDNNHGNYNVTLNSSVSPNSVIFGNSAGNYKISGSGGITGSGFVTVNGTDTVTLATNNTYTGGTNVNSGMLVIAPTTVANTVALGSGAVSIGAAGTMQLADNASASTPFVNSAADISNGLMQMSALSITAGGVLDVRNNHFYVADPGGAAHDSTFASLLGYVSNGVTNPTGGEITSTEALPGYGVGIVDGNDGVLGTPVAANQIEVAYTLDGDANLDGKVDITDFNIFAPNFGLPTTLGWEAGDFNYSGTVDIGDFNLFAGNFGLSDNGTAIGMPAADFAALDAFAAANGLTLTSVPEPASLGLLLFAATGILRRHRRNQR